METVAKIGLKCSDIDGGRLPNELFHVDVRYNKSEMSLTFLLIHMEYV